jgi:hypothetical protein
MQMSWLLSFFGPRLFLLCALTFLCASGHFQGPPKKTILAEWTPAQASKEWEDSLGNDQSYIFFVVPNGGTCDSECEKQKATVITVSNSFLMDTSTTVVQITLPGNDVGTVFGPALRLVDAIIRKPTIIFATAMHRIASVFTDTDWSVNNILESYVDVKSLDAPIDDTECLNNDLDDIAMLALDHDANLDQLIIDAKWHAEVMEGFELDCANIYIHTLVRIQERGRTYVSKEKERLTKLSRSSNTSSEKKKEMQRKINILTQFELGDPTECQGPMCGNVGEVCEGGVCQA